MDSTPGTWIPPRMAEMAASLRELTGAEPVITRPASGAWRLEMRNDRVEMIWTMKTTRSSRTVPTKSVLIIDGVRQHHLSAGPEHFAAIWANPDWRADAACARQKPAEITPEMLDFPEKDCPAEVQAAFDTVLRLGTDLSRFLRLARQDDGWVVAMDFPDKDVSLRIVYRFFAGEWRHDPDSVELFIRGENHSCAVNGDMRKALTMAMDAGEPGPGGHGPVRNAAPVASTATSVMVRKTTVIRT